MGWFAVFSICVGIIVGACVGAMVGIILSAVMWRFVLEPLLDFIEGR